MSSQLAVALCLLALMSSATSEQLDSSSRASRTKDAVQTKELVNETDAIDATYTTEGGSQFVRNSAKPMSKTGVHKAMMVDADSDISDLLSKDLEVDKDEADEEDVQSKEGSSAALMQRSSEHEEADVVSSVELLDKTIAKKGHKHPPQHCEWNAFGGWGACDKPCGGGSQSRSRSVKKKAERGGNACSGAASETQACNTNPCPIDCKWDKWDDWSDCSKSCGGGEKKRSREKEVKAQHGGMDCDGDSKEEMDCNTHDCPTVPPPVTKSLATGKACSILAAVTILISMAL